MNRHLPPAPAGRKGRFDLGAVSRVLWLALLACAVPATASARQQSNVTALIPDKVTSEQDAPLQPGAPLVISGGQFGSSGLKIHFQVGPLPSGAKVTAAGLSLFSSGPPSASQTVNVDDARTSARLGAQTLARAKEGRAYWPLNGVFVDAVNAGGRDFLFLMSTGSSARSSWHSIDSADVNYRPRLILEYTVPGEPLTQSDGMPAARSPRAFLPSRDGASGGPFYYAARPFPAAWSYAPAFFNNMVYLITDDDGRRNLRAFDALGNPAWSVMLPGSAVGQHLLVSNDGRLFVVGAGRILVYQLDPASPSTPPAAAARDVRAENLKPSAPPTLGPDGGLYFVNGMEVYGLNPALQQLWKVTLGDNRTSRVTVGPSGRFVYLTTAGEGLVTVNAQTGESFFNPLPNQDALKNAGNPALHAPVVIRHPDGTEKIYAAADSVNDGALALFNNPKTTPGAGDSGKITPAGSGWPLKGLWSRPLPDQLSPGSEADPNPSKRLYTVAVANGVGTLKAVNWLNAATTDMTPQLKSASSYLLSGGNLTTDEAGNRYVWNGAADGGLYAFGAAFSGLLNPSAAGVIPVRAQFYFGGDGTMYANDIDGRTLWAVVPQYTLGADSAGANIYSPTHLRADGTVTKDTTLAAGGSVILGADFKVRQGATLTIRTGAPR